MICEGSHDMTLHQLIHEYQNIRKTTEELCQPLEIEDYVVQSVEDVSPPKWHLAHTSWFFETFILIPYVKKFKVFDPDFQYIFNSYYQCLGDPYPRKQRGVLSRPTVKTIYAYRKYVDEQLLNLLQSNNENKLSLLVKLGLHHEQQHQELLLMDIKHNFSLNPNNLIYASPDKAEKPPKKIKLDFLPASGGTIKVGHVGDGFCFDNELPLHIQFLNPFLIANRLVTNEEYLAFIEAGAYKKPNWWLADGWNEIQKNQWQSPLYWKKISNQWYEFTLTGLKKLILTEPVAHVSYYEAEAYARWCNARLPTEMEWENFVSSHIVLPDNANLLESKTYHPSFASNENAQFYGDLWEWTASSYSPYPGFKSLDGALGEYNGKFMSNQFVLRGGSCATPQSHIRASYRNFFQPEKRWQFSGIRLAKDE